MDTEFIFISSQLPLNKLQLLKRDEILKTQDYFLFDKIDTFFDSLSNRLFRPSIYDNLELYRYIYTKPLYNCIWRVPTAGFAEQNGRNAKLNSR